MENYSLKKKKQTQNITSSAKFLANELLFFKCKTLKNAYNNIYGFGYFRYNFAVKRFEKKKISINTNLNKFIFVKLIRSFLPYNRDLYKRYCAHLYRLYIIKHYKSVRHVLGLPVRGQRTWSNANSQKKSNLVFKKIFAAKAWQRYPFLTKTYSNTAALAEFANYMFKNNWTKEWIYAGKQIEETINKKSDLAKVDLYAMSRFFIRVNRGEYKVSKKTKQKRKIVKQAGFTTGFKINFVKKYLCKSARELRHMYLQFYYTKTTRMVFEKELSKKKKKKKSLGKGVKSMKVARKMRKKKKKTLWD